MGPGPGILPLAGLAHKTVVVFILSGRKRIIANDKLIERLLAGNVIVGCGQPDADLEVALAGSAVEITLCQNSQGLAEVHEQGIADRGWQLELRAGPRV